MLTQKNALSQKYPQPQKKNLVKCCKKNSKKKIQKNLPKKNFKKKIEERLQSKSSKIRRDLGWM